MINEGDNMSELTTRVLDNAADSLSLQISKVINYAGTVLVFLVLFLFAYVIGAVMAEVLRKVLKCHKLQEFILKYSIMRAKAWDDTINFLVFYTRWFIAVSLLTLSDIPLITLYLYPLMNNLFGLIILILVGLTLGGIVSRIIRDISIDFGWEEKLVRYGLADALGDISITSLLTGIIKSYILLLFLAQGVERFENLTILSKFMNDVIAYAPQAVLGAIIMLVALLIADYVGDRIKNRKVDFEEMLAFCVKSVIIFFGGVIALPHFGITNVSILEDSFKILVAGVSLALAIALGLGLKDFVFRLTQKYEEKRQ